MANPLPKPDIPGTSSDPKTTTPVVSRRGAELIAQPHGGSLQRGSPGNRGHILRKRKQYVAWLALQELKDRLVDPERAALVKDPDLISAAKLDGTNVDLTTGGEPLKQRVVLFGGLDLEF